MKINFYCLLMAVVMIAASCSSGQKSETAADTDTIKVAEKDAWENLPAILANIKAPTFPDKDFLITDFGAKGDGKTNCTEAFKMAIAACNQAGGGRVVVPEGKFFTGPIHLKSNVNLHVKKDAVILFSTKPKDYLPLVYTRWEGIELMNYSPLVYAFEQENVAITGEGVLDGQGAASNWWPWKGKTEYGWKEGMKHQKQYRDTLFAMAERNVPVKDRVFGEGFYLRPQFIQPYKCKNVLIEGVTFKNSPMWILNPVLCTNVTVQKVTIESMGPNSDGCDPESCKDVLIKDCYFNTGDDCIAIKSGRNADGRRINIPSENIIIQDCKMANGHGGVGIGSEISGGIKNVYVENCKMSSPHLERALRIKTSSMRGGVTDGIYLRNIEVGEVAQQFIQMTTRYEDSGAYVPTIKNVQIKDVTVGKGGKTGILLDAYEQQPIENVKLINIKIDSTGTPYSFTNVKNVTFENVEINGKKVLAEPK